MKPIRVAFVASNDASFIRMDEKLLRSHFHVRRVPWNGKRSIPGLAWAVLRSDVTFSWFALDHAYGACRLARLFGRKSVVVVAGVDAARIPELGYGAHLDPKVSARSRYALLHSDCVLVVDDFLREEIASNAGIRRPEILTVPTGCDTEYFRPDEGPRKNVLTVGIVTDVNLRRKGLETFVRAARLVPELPFVLVGGGENSATQQLRAMAPPNLRLVPKTSHDELLKEYRAARVYVQASSYEGLPNALAEAMSCGCVPVGTRVAGIPHLIGDTGLYVPVADPQATAAAIRTAYATGDGAAARARIVTNFSIERRELALRKIVEDLVEVKQPRV